LSFLATHEWVDPKAIANDERLKLVIGASEKVADQWELGEHIEFAIKYGFNSVEVKHGADPLAGEAYRQALANQILAVYCLVPEPVLQELKAAEAVEKLGYTSGLKSFVLSYLTGHLIDHQMHPRVEELMDEAGAQEEFFINKVIDACNW
jgi:hypothetical protein